MEDRDAWCVCVCVCERERERKRERERELGNNVLSAQLDDDNDDE